MINIRVSLLETSYLLHEDVHCVVVACCGYNFVVVLSSEDVDYSRKVVEGDTHYVLERGGRVVSHDEVRFWQIGYLSIQKRLCVDALVIVWV